MKHRRRRSLLTALITFVLLLAVLVASAIDWQTKNEPKPTEISASVEIEAETEELIVDTEEDADEAETQKAVQNPLLSPELQPDPEPEIDENELEMLACVIYSEAGGDAYSDLARQYVGDVVLNRVADLRFPDTLEGVLLQEGQYGRFHWTGIVWPERAQYEVEAAAVARAYDVARALLSGEHSEIYGAGYIWQAEFSQGTDVIYLDGIYFGR